MADPIPYTGVSYDTSLYRQPNESMADYMYRLAKTRAGGVLGGGGMLDTASPASAAPSAAVVDPVAQQITSTALGSTTYGGGDSTTSSGWDRMKTQEQSVAEAMARQAEFYHPNDPSTVIGMMPIPAAGLFGLAAEGLGNYMDTKTIEGYLDKVGFTDQYGEDATKAMAENPMAMMHLMSTGDMPAVGGFERVDLSKYEKPTWGTELSNIGKGLVNSIFGTDYELWSQPAMGSYSLASTDPAIRSTVGMFDTIDGQQINTLEDVLNTSTVGNKFAGYGNYDPVSGGYTIGTAANRNADGSYTIGTAANKNADGSYTIGKSTGESPIAATNTSSSSSSGSSDSSASVSTGTVDSTDMGWGLDTGGYSYW